MLRRCALVNWRGWFVRNLAAIIILWPQLPLCAAVTVLHHFGPANPGPWPEAGLTLVGDTLFGTTDYGATAGTVYSIGTDGANFRTLHEFTSSTGRPTTPLTVVDGRLFGASANGYIYGIDPNGGNFARFRPIPFAPFAIDGDLATSGTTLFGVTSVPGSPDKLFSIETDGSNYQTLHTLTSFEGFDLWNGIIRVGDTLFGTAAGSLRDDGSGFTGGTIFSMRTDGSNFQRLHVFQGDPVDGWRPQAGLTELNGRLFGTTYENRTPAQGEFSGSGTLFAIDLAGSNYQVLVDNFLSKGLVHPQAGLTAVDNRLYGTTASSPGGIFSILSDGTDFRVEHRFNLIDGSLPRNARLLAVGNRLYGVTARGGDYNGGTLFYLQIPEPSTLLLLGIGALVGTRRL